MSNQQVLIGEQSRLINFLGAIGTYDLPCIGCLPFNAGYGVKYL